MTPGVVPCGSCQLCCKGQDVFLFPGEDANGLPIVPGIIPASFGRAARPAMRLTQKPNGDCAHLGPDGCTVYDQRPRTCRIFDCREHYFLPSAERRRIEAVLGPHDRAIIARGRQIVEASR